jgi:hypothetical protein
LVIKQLEQQLWNITNTLRGKMNADEFRDYILGFIFYKYLAEKMEIFANDILKQDKLKFRNLTGSDEDTLEIIEAVKDEALEKLSYFLKPDELFSEVAKRGNSDIDGVSNFILEDLQKILTNIQLSTMSTESEGDFANWKEMKFGSVFTFRTTNSLSREKLNYDDGKVKNIHYGDIHTKFNLLFDITKEPVPYINIDVELKRIDADNYCKESDLIIADASEDYADIGKSIEIISLNNEKILAGLHTFLARPNLNMLALGYSGYLIKSENVRLQIMTIAQGSKVLSISTSRLSNILIPVPCIEEQTKIVNFLSAIDNKINHCQSQIEKTEIWKKGLLQQMFV